MAKKQKNIDELRLGQPIKLIQLDKYIKIIFYFTDLKLFGYYSKVAQSTGNEQKIIVKQLISIATLLLVHNNSEVIYCTHAIVDFTILA